MTEVVNELRSCQCLCAYWKHKVCTGDAETVVLFGNTEVRMCEPCAKAVKHPAAYSRARAKLARLGRKS